MHALLDGIDTQKKSGVVPKWIWLELVIWWGSRRNCVFSEWWPGDQALSRTRTLHASEGVLQLAGYQDHLLFLIGKSSVAYPWLELHQPSTSLLDKYD